MHTNLFPNDFPGNQVNRFLARVEAIEGEQAAYNKVQVRIFGQQDMDFPISKLPWATVEVPTSFGVATGAGAIHSLQVADLVTGYWLDPEHQMPMITGVIMGAEPMPDKLLSSSSSSSSSSTAQTPALQTNQSDPTEPDENEEPHEEANCEDISYTDQGLLGASGDRSFAATLRHNNPLGNYPAGFSSKFGTTGWQRIGGGHKIASFNSTIDGYGNSLHQMHRNAVKANRVTSDGRVWTTPRAMGDEHQTGYTGNDIANAVGNNDRLYFDTWSDGWDSALSAMESREASKNLYNKARSKCSGVGSDYDFGQNSGNKQAGFNKMQSVNGYR